MKRKSKLEQVHVDPKRARFELKPDQKNEDTTESKLDSLPDDLFLDILTRLPAKTVVNSRRVSKRWYSIIRSQRFYRMFSSVSSTRPRLVVALSNGLDNDLDEMLTLFFSFDQGDSSSSSLVPSFDMAMPDVRFCSFSGFCTSVHQFLTVATGCDSWICNPVTEQFAKLPHGDGTTYVAYDPIADHYKALCVTLMNNHKVTTIGRDKVWRHLKPPTTTAYTPMGAPVTINGCLYYGAWSESIQGIMCFDVRSENLSYIKAPLDVLGDHRNSVLGEHRKTAFFEYKGKLASTVFNPFTLFKSFDLWVLEDVEKHEWSKTTCVVPPSMWHFRLSFPGTNRAGEIIMAPKELSRHVVQPFYIFYYNVGTRNIRRVRLLGIGDSQEFRRSYGFTDHDECHLHIVPQHIESTFLFKTSRS